MIKRLPELKTRIMSDAFVALLVSLILWSIIMSRKNEVRIHHVQLEFLLQPKYSIVNDVQKKVSIKIKGLKSALEKMNENPPLITVDLNRKREGWHKVILSKDHLGLPLGVELISITPNTIITHIKEQR